MRGHLGDQDGTLLPSWANPVLSVPNDTKCWATYRFTKPRILSVVRYSMYASNAVRSCLRSNPLSSTPLCFDLFRHSTDINEWDRQFYLRWSRKKASYESSIRERQRPLREFPLLSV